MKTFLKQMTYMLLAAACFVTMGTASADVRISPEIRISSHGDDNINIDDQGNVHITANDKSEARINPAGDLLVAGKNVPINDKQRTLLLQYANAILGIERKGMQIGLDGANLALGVIGSVFADLMTGANRQDIDKDTKSQTGSIKESARGLCDSVKSLQRLQGEVGDSISAFEPYEVITADSVKDCYDGLNEDKDED